MPTLTRESIRILHVEDDDEFAELSALSLRRVGFAQPVARCRDGILALRYFSALDPACGPHVVLLDLHMPRMSGLEVLHWLRHYRKSCVAVYLLTSSDHPEHKRQAEEDRVTEYLIKSPFTDSLVEKLDLLIARLNAEEGSEAPKNGNAAVANQGLASFAPAEAFARSGSKSSR